MSADPASKRILLVEDDESLRELIQLILEREGFSVEGAPGGAAGLASAKAQPPDVMVLDLMMPEISGFDVLESLRKDGVKVPVVVISGRYTDRVTHESLKRSANVAEFFQKPVKPVAFVMYLHRLLGTQPPALNRGVDVPD